ncbi:acyl-CoA synthetase (AMP-forming)/AMP-acid ligase II [Synechococcus sp. PCC 7502]|uniref:acyl-CoA synthetase n=1 Tax=Synechococcus sp. PCC 7502 TaxID=1173263 RepID=UPI00029FCF53|nr:acyl-CoA synthetase [Synechococcus sp. PCC 7502]AFY74719.1 acyl-CoA synthetase (AMP-forming)/AMP-acid ligase II [Synechococcus sp. PCC 7502]
MNLPFLPLISRAQEFSQNIAIAVSKKETEQKFTYQDLLTVSQQIARVLLENNQDLQNQRIAFLIPSGFDYVATLWGIWRAGGIAVPLCVVHPLPELEYVIRNTGASVVIAHPDFAATLQAIAHTHNLRFILTCNFFEPVFESVAESAFNHLPKIETTRPALILYTSGTTGKPKGVVLTHANLEAQITSLVTAWAWQSSDRILHVLPLHHIHGIVNVLLCALWVGAECVIIPKFDPELVWHRICAGDLTLFMAVPTIYVKLISAWQKASKQKQQELSASANQLRLMVSGSAALPKSVLETWQRITGHFLLERYGMTEIGMALSNPVQGDRLAGYVGQPLPNVEVRLIQEQGESAGEIQVKGAGVFLEYWQNPEATAKAFIDGWFRTGDLAVCEDGNYRILGRISVDIIKTGGYKVSALEIEEVIRTHPHIQECAVVGVNDPEWGERVCAAMVLKSPAPELPLSDFRSWAKQHLAVYKVPSQILILPELPRNPMGKVTKPAIAKLF